VGSGIVQGYGEELRLEYEGAIYHVMIVATGASRYSRATRSCDVSGNPQANLPEDGLAGARVVSDGQSLSLGRWRRQGQSGGGDEMVPGDLHGAIQPAAQVIGHLFSGRYKALIWMGAAAGI